MIDLKELYERTICQPLARGLRENIIGFCFIPSINKNGDRGVNIIKIKSGATDFSGVKRTFITKNQNIDYLTLKDMGLTHRQILTIAKHCSEFWDDATINVTWKGKVLYSFQYRK